MHEAIQLSKAARSGIARVLGRAAIGFAGVLVFAFSLAASSAPASAAPLPTNCTQSGLVVTCTYTYTGGEQTFFAPPGVTSVNVDAIGGAGGQSANPHVLGGEADEVTGGVSLTPGQVLYVEVAGAGGPGGGVVGGDYCDWVHHNCFKGLAGFNGGGTGGDADRFGGGGGGGASDVRTCSRSDSTCTLTGDAVTDPRRLVASGGAGGTYEYNGGNAGGGDGNPSADSSCDIADPNPSVDCVDKGRGGTASGGGLGGYGAGSGSAGQGGNGANDRSSFGRGGGGGGGGWFGGGGGGEQQVAGEPPESDHIGGGTASGGGGSNLIPTGGSAALTTSAAKVVITYDIVDSTAPTITISSPGDGATYNQGQVVNADYSCSDDGLGASGVNSCDGPVPSGSAIDTSTLGDHAFTVTATDKAGNSTSKTVHYAVAAGGSPDTPASHGPAPQSLTPASPSPEPAAHVGLSHRTVKTKRGRALFTLKCIGLPRQICHGDIRLLATGLRSRLQSAGSHGHSRAFSIPAGTSLAIWVPLPIVSDTQLQHRHKSVAMAVVTPLGGTAQGALVTRITAIAR